jgi:hypothetical protein
MINGNAACPTFGVPTSPLTSHRSPAFKPLTLRYHWCQIVSPDQPQDVPTRIKAHIFHRSDLTSSSEMPKNTLFT